MIGLFEGQNMHLILSLERITEPEQNRTELLRRMDKSQEQIDKLSEKLELLLQVHTHFSKEIKELREEIEQLKKTSRSVSEAREESKATPPSEEAVLVSEERQPTKPLFRDPNRKILGGVCAGLAERTGMNLLLMRLIWVAFSLLFCVGVVVYLILWISLPEVDLASYPHASATPSDAKENMARAEAAGSKKPVDLEKYIGENLISKIGIGVLIIGVGIGAKYSIDNELISPLVRIILGYLVGTALLGLSFKLRAAYENFSSVLLSGAMAIFYFITYAAYAFYGILPSVPAFLLMVIFTVATVAAALRYNQQFIAHIGLVGAYAVPFLLSEGEGRILILFSYMAIINCGILVVAFKKYWKPLYMVAFFVTWLIVLSWYFFSYEAEVHFMPAVAFCCLFFLLFYGTFLAYKILKKEAYETLDVVLVLFNSFVFYGLGYGLIDSIAEGENYLGFFTLCNALLHMAVGIWVYRQKSIDKNIYYLISGLVLLFITLTIPVQLDGNWVSLLWLGEAAVLFWVGKTKGVALYEKLAYPLLLLACISLGQDWDWAYSAGSERFSSFWNPTFLTSLIFCGVLGYVNYIYFNKKYPPAFPMDEGGRQLLSIGLATLLIGIVYATFALEISYYWEGRFQASATGDPDFGSEYNYDLLTFKTLWQLLYFMAYTALLLGVNSRWIKSRALGMLGLCLTALGLMVFLTTGLYDLSELRESYLSEVFLPGQEPGIFYLGIRYLAIITAGTMLLAAYRYMKNNFKELQYHMVWDLVLSTTILWVASSELIHWLDLSGAPQAYKLWLTIFWGVFALGLIVIGIWKSKKHLRVAAIVLFSITLLKLVFYDLVNMSTLSKTAVFVLLGILLLIISFLYNKFKGKLWEDKEE
jgi:uncharacterized membrane protein